MLEIPPWPVYDDDRGCLLFLFQVKVAVSGMMISTSVTVTVTGSVLG